MTPGATRARFRERQVLRAADLQAEQSYLVAMRRRHNVGAHGWGVVRGLELVVAVGGLYVEPGMAVDGYGRELFVAERLALPPQAFDELDSAQLDVWLVYDRGEEVAAPRGRFDCGQGRGNRWREHSRLRLTAARESDPRAPEQVPDADLNFGPHRDPPDDPAREWPVFLGTFGRVPADLTKDFTYTAAYAARPYASLVGQSVDAPSKSARMQVAEELAGQTQRFSVAVPDAAGNPVERLALDREGRATLRGHTTLGRRLRIRKGEAEEERDAAQAVVDYCAPARHVSAEEATHAVILRRLAATPAAAAPWQLYRVSGTKDGRTAEQLRFEIKHPGDKGDPKTYSLAVGSLDLTQTFRACLSVGADCRVTVAQDLEVRGRVVEGAVKADVSDPRFINELRTQWEKGRAVAEDPSGDVTADLQVAIIVLDTQPPPTILPAPGEMPEPPDDRVVLTVGDRLAFAVRVTNTGRSTITNVQLHGHVNYKGRAQTFSARPVTLGKGADAYFPSPGQAPLLLDRIDSPGTIIISATVTGVGPLANVITASDTVTGDVSAPPVVTPDPTLSAEIVVLPFQPTFIPTALPPAIEGVLLFERSQLPFAVRVTKNGPGTITNVVARVQFRFEVSNTAPAQTALLPPTTPTTLSGTEVSIPPAGAAPFIYPGAPMQGHLTISVTVTGVAPSSATLSATDTLDIFVQRIIT